MERILLVLLFITGFNVYAQIPEGYYSSTSGLDGIQLKDALYNIIKGHTEYYYTSSSTDAWDILKDADKDPDNGENVILIYSGESVNAAQEYNNGNGWTREHVWAKSRGDFGTSKGPGTDCHNLKACSSSLNSTRSNRAFGENGGEVWYNNSFTGCYVGSSYTFEPRDAMKGDVARIIFYMATRYNGDDGEPNLDLTELILPTTDKQPIHGVKTILLKWHKEDPVDDFEVSRNNAVYSYQHNRNPFVDHPEFVDLIWGNATAIQKVSSEFNNVKCIVKGTSLHIESTISFNKVDVYNMAGQKVSTIQSGGVYEMDLNLIDKGIYIVVIDNDQILKVCM
ncbi:endonuclease [Carboxylicivirga caseinilyticus]|uniref:endonuclease n=1 Tax=Carboxylicivirga caseinilyticus TaxID=3417572 RepID=UPI003D32F080|nr:endonuclease [Marinilabiliaceae bacterium A049]